MSGVAGLIAGIGLGVGGVLIFQELVKRGVIQNPFEPRTIFIPQMTTPQTDELIRVE